MYSLPGYFISIGSPVSSSVPFLIVSKISGTKSSNSISSNLKETSDTSPQWGHFIRLSYLSIITSVSNWFKELYVNFSPWKPNSLWIVLLG